MRDNLEQLISGYLAQMTTVGGQLAVVGQIDHQLPNPWITQISVHEIMSARIVENGSWW